MKKYIRKSVVVEAMPMTRAAYNTTNPMLPLNFGDGDEQGYMVHWPEGDKNHPDYDGFVSWLQVHAFRKAYREISNMTFGQALEALKAGKHVARKNWNGKGLKVYLHRPLGEISLPFLALAYPENPFSYYRNGAIVPWVASQTDMLEEDWYVVE